MPGDCKVIGGICDGVVGSGGRWLVGIGGGVVGYGDVGAFCVPRFLLFVLPPGLSIKAFQNFLIYIL